MILVAAIFIQVKTIKAATIKVGTTIKDNNNLKDEFLLSQGKFENLKRTLENKQKELEKVRLSASTKNEKDTQNELDIKNNQKLLGLTDVSGPGFIITLEENKEVKPSDVLNISGYLVHEEDLLYIVNELFNSGADAVSINDQRIIGTSSIQCDGNIIRINGKMVGVPITIKAIGYPERLDGALNRPGGYLQMMATDGIKISTSRSENITIQKYEGVYSSEYLKTGGDI